MVAWSSFAFQSEPDAVNKFPLFQPLTKMSLADQSEGFSLTGHQESSGLT
jgi:hypothetical protein